MFGWVEIIARRHNVDPVWAVGMVVLPIIGMALHELTHYVVARVMRVKRVRIIVFGGAPYWAVWDWSPLVEYEIENHRSTVVDRLINLSPLLVGGAAAIAGFVTGVELSKELAPIGLGWFYYTLGGGLEDYSMTVASGKHWWRDQCLHVKQTYGGFAIYVIGLYITSIYRPEVPESLPDTVYTLMTYSGLGLMFGGGIVVAMGLRNVDTLPESHPLRTPVKKWILDVTGRRT